MLGPDNYVASCVRKVIIAIDVTGHCTLIDFTFHLQRTPKSERPALGVSFLAFEFSRYRRGCPRDAFQSQFCSTIRLFYL